MAAVGVEAPGLTLTWRASKASPWVSLHRNEAHVGPLHGFADRGGIGRVVLAAPAAHSVRRHELGGHQLDGVAVGCEPASPVMGTRAGFDADGARRQCGHPFVELCTV